MSEDTVARDSSADTVAVVATSLLTVVAVAGNLALLVVIVRSRSLRVQLTNFFVVNVCVIDLVAASVVMPMSLAGVNTQSSSTNSTLSHPIDDHPSTSSSTNTTLSRPIDDHPSTSCTVFRLLCTFVVFASVLSIALANVERYVSIRYPMQHAAHLTVGRTMTAIVGVWAVALGVAATPVVADWDILDVGARCCAAVVSSTPPAAAVFAIFVVALLFVAPALIIAVMCCSIYRVARQAGRQIVPGVDDRHPPPGRLPSTVGAASCSVVRSSASCPTLNNIRPHHDVANSATVIRERGVDTTSPLPTIRGTPECVIRITSHETGATTAAIIGDHGRPCRPVCPTPTRVVEAQLTAGAAADRRWKAAATLLFVLLTFVPLWSPYFAYSVFIAIQLSWQVSACGPTASDGHVETAVVWIGFTTFAINAFVYGWMNRAIRDALRDMVDETFGHCSLVARGRARLSQVLGAGDAEDFFQFLERTSSFDRTQSSAASVELTTVN